MNAPTPQQLLEQFANPPTPYTDKLAELAKQLTAETDKPDEQDGYEVDAAGTFK